MPTQDNNFQLEIKMSVNKFSMINLCDYSEQKGSAKQAGKLRFGNMFH